MQKIIIAIESKKILKKILNKYNEKTSIKKVFYREGIIEELEKDKNINNIFINEKLPGEISIEELIKRIKKINKSVNIIFFINKKDEEKEKKLKELGIVNIYNKNEIKEKYKNKNTIKGKINNKIIVLFGKKEITKKEFKKIIKKRIKNKKILLIQFEKNNKLNNIEEKTIKIKNILLKSNKKDSIKSIIKILEKNRKIYKYILVDAINIKNKAIIEALLKKSDKNIYLISNNYLGIGDFIKYIQKVKEKENIRKTSLHIVCKNNYFSKIDKKIITNLIEKINNIN